MIFALDHETLQLCICRSVFPAQGATTTLTTSTKARRREEMKVLE